MTVTSDVFNTAAASASVEKDSTPHNLFVEMDEFKGNYWQEQARN